MPQPTPDPEEAAVAVFTALADPNRRAILASLAEHGPSTATDLSGRLSITRQGVAKHLALLADAGLVTSDAGGGFTAHYTTVVVSAVRSGRPTGG